MVKMDIQNSECLFFLNLKKKEEDCRSTPHIHNLSGCAILWDKLACWEPTAFGTTVNLTCPDYVPVFNNHSGRVWRNCTTDGWSDEFPRYKDACDYKANDVDQAEYKMLLTLKHVYTVGFSTSLSALLLAIVILLAFRRLHCTRNYIHVNFFLSFILRGISVFTKDIFVLQKDCETPLVWCRFFMVFLHYCVMASFSWMLVEAIYLQMLLSVSFSTRKSFSCYVLLGWGAPAFFATIWLLYKLKYNNNGCWTHLKNNFSWWIINGPIFLSIIINVIIFLYIIKVLIMKLRPPVGGSSTSHKFRHLVKATLLLIPLLGTHFSFFAFFNIKFRLIFELCTASVQGLVVAILYCFLNAEVQTQLKAAWRSWISNRQLQGQPTQQQQPPSTLSEDHMVTQETF